MPAFLTSTKAARAVPHGEGPSEPWDIMPGAVTDEGVTVTACIRCAIHIGCDSVGALVADLLGRGSCGVVDLVAPR